jgi:hypothetical protein
MPGIFSGHREKEAIALCLEVEGETGGELIAALAEIVGQTAHVLGVTVDRGLVTGSTDSMLLPRYEIANGTLEDFAATIARAVSMPSRTQPVA